MHKLAEKVQTAHQDAFCRDHLPPPELSPKLNYSGIPELAYPERMNCAVELLDKMVATRGDSTVCNFASGKWTYHDLLETSDRMARVVIDDLGMLPDNSILFR